MTGYFVTATGTDIGKTYVSAALLRHWRSEGRAVAALKPVVSGFDPAAVAGSDTGQLLAAMAVPIDAAAVERVSPWRFRAPLSPDMAAVRESRSVPYDPLVALCRSAASVTRKEDRLIVEGVGGVYVPLDDRHTVMDWMKDLGLPILLVAGSYLGTISHTLSAVAAMRLQGLTPHRIIINESEQSPVPVDETISVMKRHAPGMTILSLPRDADASAVARLADAL